MTMDEEYWDALMGDEPPFRQDELEERERTFNDWKDIKDWKAKRDD